MARGFPGVGASIVGAKAYMGRAKVSRVSEADKMVVSPRFAQAIKVAMKADAKKGDSFIVNAPVYKKWLKTITQAERDQISKVGFVTWLTATTGATSASRSSNDLPTNRKDKNK